MVQRRELICLYPYDYKTFLLKCKIKDTNFLIFILLWGDKECNKV